MNLQQIQNLSNSELLELYAQKVRCDHYDPHTTPQAMEELYQSGITQDMLAEEILSRLSRNSSN